MEPEEGLERLQEAFRVCRKYQDTFLDRSANLSQYFKETPVVEWDFQSSLVFARLERFQARLRNIEVGPYSYSHLYVYACMYVL